MIVLGIETSCDETAVAIVTSEREILANTIFSQLDTHALYGGVVPEISARGHLDKITPILDQALRVANLRLEDIDGIAATCGPGLIGGVIVGAMAGKAIALAQQKPFIAVNHLEGHALTARLTNDVAYPYLLLLMSGGHCQLLLVESLGQYTLLGQTLDDALGECFDKVGKLLDLPYPGGPKIEVMAKDGDQKRFNFPRPLHNKPGCDFSFSGLKTAVRKKVQELGVLTQQDKADVAASFQAAAGDVLEKRVMRAMKVAPNIDRFVVAGGVAANQYLCGRLKYLAEAHHKTLIAPPVKLCTDNGAMIAWVGIEYLMTGHRTALDFAPRPRWPLSDLEL